MQQNIEKNRTKNNANIFIQNLQIPLLTVTSYKTVTGRYDVTIFLLSSCECASDGVRHRSRGLRNCRHQTITAFQSETRDEH